MSKEWRPEAPKISVAYVCAVAGLLCILISAWIVFDVPVEGTIPPSYTFYKYLVFGLGSLGLILLGIGFYTWYNGKKKRKR